MLDLTLGKPDHVLHPILKVLAHGADQVCLLLQAPIQDAAASFFTLLGSNDAEAFLDLSWIALLYQLLFC